MRQYKLLLVTILALGYFPVVLANSPAGIWTTVDDQTGRKRAVVRLDVSNETLEGRILRVYSQPGDKGICSQCPGEFKDKPIEGLRFLWGLQDKGKGVWSGGHILDAKSGKIYRVKIKEKGNKLYVRGYLGLSMLGRTQIWTRVKG